MKTKPLSLLFLAVAVYCLGLGGALAQEQDQAPATIQGEFVATGFSFMRFAFRFQNPQIYQLVSSGHLFQAYIGSGFISSLTPVPAVRAINDLLAVPDQLSLIPDDPPLIPCYCPPTLSANPNFLIFSEGVATPRPKIVFEAFPAAPSSFRGTLSRHLHGRTLGPIIASLSELGTTVVSNSIVFPLVVALAVVVLLVSISYFIKLKRSRGRHHRRESTSDEPMFAGLAHEMGARFAGIGKFFRSRSRRRSKRQRHEEDRQKSRQIVAERDRKRREMRDRRE